MTNHLLTRSLVAVSLLFLPVTAAAQSRATSHEQQVGSLERELGQIGRDLERELSQLARVLGREAEQVNRELGRESARLGLELSRELGQAGREISRSIASGVGRDVARSARELSREMAHYYEQRQGPEQTDRFARAFKVGAKGALDLANISGDIVLTVGPGEEISIEAVKRVRSTDAAAAKQALADVQIEALERAGRVEVRTVYPRGDNWRQRHSGVSVDFTVRIPAGASASLKSVSGDVKAAGVKGDLRVESVSGDITCDTPGQLAMAKSVSGDVAITGAVSDGTTTIGSVSGDVTVKGLRARGIEVSSVSGEVRLWEVTTDRAAVKTISGGIEYSGALAKGGRYEMKAHSGDVRLAISDAVGFELNASSFSGDVRSDMPVTTRSYGSGSGRERRVLRGTFGDGAAVLEVSTFSGDIAIVKR